MSIFGKREYDYALADYYEEEKACNIALRREIKRLRNALAEISYCSAQNGEDAMKMRNIAMKFTREWNAKE